MEQSSSRLNYNEQENKDNIKLAQHGWKMRDLNKWKQYIL